MQTRRNILIGALVDGLIIVVWLLLASAMGCAARPVDEPPTGLQRASDAAAALKENHGTIRWHLEQAKEELK